MGRKSLSTDVMQLVQLQKNERGRVLVRNLMGLINAHTKEFTPSIVFHFFMAILKESNLTLLIGEIPSWDYSRNNNWISIS